MITTPCQRRRLGLPAALFSNPAAASTNVRTASAVPPFAWALLAALAVVLPTRAVNAQEYQWSALGAGVDDLVRCMLPFDDGSGEVLWVGGRFTMAGDMPASRIAKWDGSSWSTRGTGMNSTVTCLAVFDDGLGGGPMLYAGGIFTVADGAPANRIARWTGTAWVPVGGGLNNTVDSMQVFDDGQGGGPALYVSGLFTQADGKPAARIAKWNGTEWSNVGSGFDLRANALCVYDDGLGGGPALYAGGQFTGHVAKWNAPGWSIVGGGMSSTVTSFGVFDEGGDEPPALFAGGFFSTAGGNPAQYVARWNGAAWSALPAPSPQWPVLVMLPAPSSADGGPVLYMGGGPLEGGPLHHIASWSGSTWNDLGGGLDGTQNGMALWDDGSGAGPALVTGGLMSGVWDGEPLVNNIARWGPSAPRFDCGDPGAGSCFDAHVAPGCDDQVCCEAVCAIDPFCCKTQWDAICVGEALKFCSTAPPCDVPTETIVLRSGQCGGAPGAPCCNDATITYHAPIPSVHPQCQVSLYPLPFVTASAPTAPHPQVIISPFGVQTLPADPSARWINWQADADCGAMLPRSTLYAHHFTVNSSSVCQATITLSWAVDDVLGDFGTTPAVGAYIGPAGSPTPTPLLDPLNYGGSSSQTTAVVNITTAIAPGANTLYMYQREGGCGQGGLIYSATITICPCEQLSTPCCDDPVCTIFLRSGQHNGVPGNPGEIDSQVLWGDDIFTDQCTTNSLADGSGVLPFDFCSVPANIVAPHPQWQSSLGSDPSARWINSTIDERSEEGFPGQSVLYCHPFYPGCGEVVTSACVTFCWMVDDRLGDPAGGPADIGIYVDKGPGTPVTPIPAIFGGHYSFESCVTATIPPGAINPLGLNRLFVYQRNLGCAASGVIYSARIDLCSTCVTPPAGMEAWWPLDETVGVMADDLTGNSNDGMWQGGPTPVPGVVDGALHFNGVDDSVFVPSNPALMSGGGGDFTVDAWIRWEPTENVNPTIVTSTTASSNNWYRFALVTCGSLSCPNPLDLLFWVQSGSEGAKCRAFDVIPAAGEWIHVAATLHQPSPGDGVCTLYVNGTPVAIDDNLPTFDFNPTGTTRIGSQSPFASSSAFKGDIDEVELFCRALSEAEIRSIWEAGVLGKCKEQCWATSNRQSCGSGANTDAQATIVNRSGVGRTYSYTITETPGCTVTGMTYVPDTGTVVVGPNSTGTVNFGALASGASGYGQACFKVTFVNQSTGNNCSALGDVIYKDCSKGEPPCCDPDSIELPVGGEGFGSFQFTAGPEGANLDYQVIAVPLDATMYDAPLALGGLPPGEPIIGTLSIGPFEDIDIDFPVIWPWCGWFFEGFEVQLLVAPAGSGGPFQVLSSFMVTMADESNCPADLDGDGEVGGADLGIMLGSFGGPGAGDLDGNGVVDGGDLGLLLGAWGPCP